VKGRETMTKNEVLIYGMIVEADIFEEGHGTNEDDEKRVRALLFKTYGVTEESPVEELEKTDKILDEDKKKLAKEFREKAINFLRE
jgi:3-dehydroquinate synthetase